MRLDAKREKIMVTLTFPFTYLYGQLQQQEALLNMTNLTYPFTYFFSSI